MKNQTELKSNMCEFGVNLFYVNNYPFGDDPETRNILPQTYAMHWCMSATGIHRIFSQDHLFEFLFRLSITLKELDILDNLFTSNSLFSFNLDGINYDFTIEDIFNHFGIEIIDSTEHYIDRNSYLSTIKNKMANTIIMSHFSNVKVEITALEKNEEGGFNISRKEDIDVSEKLLSDANLFANYILDQSPSDLFADTETQFSEKLIELEERKQTMKTIPEFDISKIPLLVIHRCMLLMFDVETIKSEYKNCKEDYENQASSHIHLAWLFANNYMVDDGVLAFEVEGVKGLNHDDFELGFGGINLLVTYEDYNMEQVRPLLKGLLH